MTEQIITYFGYGSLVNRNTRPPGEEAHVARLHGWRRVWGHRVQSPDGPYTRAGQSCCSLSVEPVIGTDRDFIDGVVVSIPASQLQGLDEREAGYDRVKLPASQFTLPTGVTVEHVYVYVSAVANTGDSNEHFPVLQSYVDCVLAGYQAVFGQQGVRQFVDSTTGWNGVIENDRQHPRYPRAVELAPTQLAQFDALIKKRRSASGGRLDKPESP